MFKYSSFSNIYSYIWWLCDGGLKIILSGFFFWFKKNGGTGGGGRWWWCGINGNPFHDNVTTTTTTTVSLYIVNVYWLTNCVNKEYSGFPQRFDPF